jgi:hypothetical protein
MSAISGKNGGNGRSARLVSALAEALRRPVSHRADPIVVEDFIADTNRMHVVVIWDRWKGVHPDERRRVIVDAFHAAKRLDEMVITAALGVTCLEAYESGLLPYGIVAMHRPTDKVPFDKLIKTINDEEQGVHVTVGESTQLRFPTLDQAEDAYRRLSTHVPGPYWAIVQEVRT